MSVTSAAACLRTGSPMHADLVGSHGAKATVGPVTEHDHRERSPKRPGSLLRSLTPQRRRPAPRTVAPRPARACTLDLATDSGVFSADRVDPGTKLLLLDGPADARWPQPCSTSAAATAPIAVHPGPSSRPRRHACGRSTSTSGRSTCAARNAEATGVGDRVRVWPARRACRPTCGSTRSGRTRRSGSARPLLHELLLDALAGAAGRRRHGRSSWSRSTSAPTRWPGWLDRGRAGRPDALGSRAGYRLLEVAAAA